MAIRIVDLGIRFATEYAPLAFDFIERYLTAGIHRQYKSYVYQATGLEKAIHLAHHPPDADILGLSDNVLHLHREQVIHIAPAAGVAPSLEIFI